MDWWWRSPDCLDFLIGMCSITQFGLFVCLVGVFSVIPYRLICSSPLGSLHHRRAWRPLLLSYASSSTIDWRVLVDTCSSGMVSLPGEFPGALNRLVTSTLICTGCFLSPSILRHLFRRACWACLYRPLFFDVDDLLAVLWPTCFAYDCLTGCVGRLPIRLPPSSLWRSAVSGRVVAQRRRRRRYKGLALEMKIHRPSYLLFLTCRVVFGQRVLCTSMRLAVVVVTCLRVKRVSSILHELF